MRRFTLLFVTLLAISACGNNSQPPLVAENLVIYEPLPGRAMTAGYLELTNHSADAIRINRVGSPDFDAVELHESSVDDGVAKMRPIDALVIAPGATVTLQQGGLHLMLIRPKPGHDTVTLNFYQDSTMLLSATAPMTRRSL